MNKLGIGIKKINSSILPLRINLESDVLYYLKDTPIYNFFC